MSTATVTSKGQITIPAAVREAMQIETGDRIDFVETGPGRFEVVAASSDVAELKGMLGKAKRSVSIDQMNEAIRSKGAKAR